MKRQQTILNATILALLCLFGLSAKAQMAWNFTTISDADKALMNGDAANWHDDTAKGRYNLLTAIDGTALMAGTTELSYAKGLLFTAAAGKDNTNGKIRLNYKDQRLELNGGGITITIPDLKAGQIVTVTCKTAKSTEARGINVGNITPTEGFFNATSLDQQTNKGNVTADGNVTLTTSAGMNITAISVEDAQGGGGDEPQPGTSLAVSRDLKKNQMHVTLKTNDILFYNTADLQSVDIQGDNVTINGLDGTTADDLGTTVGTIGFAKATEQGGGGDIENPEGKVAINVARGWHESAYVEWAPFSGASSYAVYVKGGKYSEYTKLDAELVRNYGSYGRADAIGLTPADDYCLKVVPVIDGTEIDDNANEATAISVAPYKREGFAFMGKEMPGAYNADGTLKANARVIYVTAETAKTVQLDVTGAGTCTGLQAIISGYQKGKETRPLAVRIIGLLKKADMDALGSSSEGLQIKGRNNTVNMNITIEGVGKDAAIWGFGILMRNAVQVELRNFAIMLCMDDCVSLDTDNKYCWVHNLDLFYGNTGGDADQAKGDGTLDVKGDSQYITFSANHLFDAGKASLCGMTSESGPNYISYNHNWFDHGDSRHPRVRTMTVHVWNNYFDGVAKYGVGSTMGSDVFVENNYFRGTKYPMLTSLQGTDIAADGSGTFSGEDGGSIKSFGNVFAEKPGTFRYVTYQDNNVEFDAYEAATRDEQVPSTVKSKVGGNTYSNFDTDASVMYTYSADATADVPAVVTGWHGAGRMEHGDFAWDFTGKDADYSVDSALKQALQNYTSPLVGIFGSTAEPGGGTEDPGQIEGTITCNFEAGAPSNSLFTVTGNYSGSKGSVTVDGTTYNKCLKMESATQVAFTTSAEMTMTLYMGTADSKCSIKADGTKLAGDMATHTITTTLAAGSHTLTKADSCNLFLIKLEPVAAE